MTVRRGAIRSPNPRRSLGDKIKDEVYRQMFRLEAGRKGADLALAVALLRGWVAANSEAPKLNSWLKKVCPICILMIEVNRQPAEEGSQPLQNPL